MCGKLEGATLPREGGRRHRNRAALACKRLRSRYNVGASAAVNPRCRIITFEGANEQANWRMEGVFPCSGYTVQETKMIQETKMKFALIGAAAFAAAAFATPALAQAVIEEPGYCAQFYPNANCQNLGPGNPYTDGSYDRDRSNGNALMSLHA